MRNYIVPKILFIALVSVIMFSSCEKNDEKIIVLNNSGTLTIKVLDENNQPCNDATVSIYSNGNLLFQDTTNTSGIFNVGKLLYGEYQYRVSAKKENRVYGDTRVVQIVAGENKVIQVNPYSYVSKVKFTVFNAYNGEVIPDRSVGLLTYSNSGQSQLSTLEDYIKLCYFIKKTDLNGEVIFENVPVGSINSTAYKTIVFEDNTNWEVISNTFYVYPHETKSYLLEVYN